MMDRRSDRHPKIARCEGMCDQREIEMGASGGGQPIRACGEVAARTGRTQTRNRHDSSESKSPLTRGGRPHNPFEQHAELRRCDRHLAIGRRRPHEAAFLQPLGEQTETLAIPPQHLQQIAAATAKDKEVTAERGPAPSALGPTRRARQTPCACPCGRPPATRESPPAGSSSQ